MLGFPFHMNICSRLFNNRPRLSGQTGLRLVQGGDNGLAALALLQKINGSRYLGQHGGKLKLALLNVFLGLGDVHMVNGLLAGGSVI